MSVQGGVSVHRGSLCREGGHCPWGLCLEVSVQEGLYPGGLCLGVFVQEGLYLGGLCPGSFCPVGSLSMGGLCPGSLCLGGSLPGWGLCPGWHLSVQWGMSMGSLSRVFFSRRVTV